MTPLVFVLTALAGGVGAVLRFGVDAAVSSAWGRRFPWGIAVVNVTGSLLLGLATGVVSETTWIFVIGAGLLGGYTTFSTAMLDTVQLAARREGGRAFAHAVGTLLATVAAAALGLVLGSLL